MVKADVGLRVIINVNDHTRNLIYSLAEGSKAYLATFDCVLGLRIFIYICNIIHHFFFFFLSIKIDYYEP